LKITRHNSLQLHHNIKQIDLFSQDDKRVKHWSFKSSHGCELFEIPVTNNKIDISVTALVG